jgi:hypothetical protein
MFNLQADESQTGHPFEDRGIRHPLYLFDTVGNGMYRLLHPAG